MIHVKLGRKHVNFLNTTLKKSHARVTGAYSPARNLSPQYGSTPWRMTFLPTQGAEKEPVIYIKREKSRFIRYQEPF